MKSAIVLGQAPKDRRIPPPLIPAGPVASDELVVPAVAHTNGVNGTVWRSAAHLTNTSDDVREWHIAYYPRGINDLRPTRRLRLVPHQTIAISSEVDRDAQDVVSWVIGYEAPIETQGTLRITSADGGNGMPLVNVRTYNALPAGTFGQAVPALSAAQGASSSGRKKRLLLTGLSTEDIARSNLGFVSLGGPASFSVRFYDEAGTIINPGGAPYTVSLGVDGWEQVKLENRWQGTGWPVVVNRRISVEAVVTQGTGYAYASVVDPQTGDPVFIGAHPAP